MRGDYAYRIKDVSKGASRRSVMVFMSPDRDISRLICGFFWALNWFI